MFSPTDYLFYYLLAFKYYFMLEKRCERNREREKKRRRKFRDKIIKNYL
jgi:hypothetical protein